MDSIDWPSGNPETINYKGLDVHLSKYQVWHLLNEVKTCKICSVGARFKNTIWQNVLADELFNAAKPRVQIYQLLYVV